MPENVSFQFELVDKVTASASRMERSLVNIERALTHTQGAARAGSGSWALFGIKMGAVAGIAAEATRGLLELGGQVLKMGATGAKWALEAGSFNENTQLSLQAILGSAAAAQKAVSTWQALAERTPFDARNVIEWGKQLTIAGETVENTVTLIKAAADLGTKLGATPEKQRETAEQVLGVFQRIKQLGSEASFRNLRPLADLGISPQKMEENLAARLTGGNIAVLRKGMEQARATGQDLSHEIILAGLQAVQDSTGPLGALGEKGAATLSSHLTRLKDRLEFDIFKGIENTKGYKALDKILVNLIAVFGSKGFANTIRDMSNALGEALAPLTGTEGRKNMVAFFNDLKAGIDKTIPGLVAIAKAVGALAKWGIVKPVQGIGMIADIGHDIGNVLERKAPETKTGRDFLDALYGDIPGPQMVRTAPAARQGVPPMLMRPSLNITNVVHVHGNADTDSLEEKIDARTQESFEAFVERMSIMAGA